MSVRVTFPGFFRSTGLFVALAALVALSPGLVLALDVTRPAAVTGVTVDWAGEDVDWTPAEPSDLVVSYRCYYGKASGVYEYVEEMGLATSASLALPEVNVAWYIAVTAGDPWDRLAQFFLVLDDCIEAGGSCITPNNFELMRAITPFGTDAEPPDGTGYVDPRVLDLDVTPFLPLLTGTRHVGAEIGHYVQKGHWITIDFRFSKNPFLTSTKPPADGIEIVGFGHAPLPVREVSIPQTATRVKARIFTTGHGGSSYCDGGTNNGESCVNNADCPGGVCYPCDEFCHRLNRLKLNGTPIWEVTPFRTDCSPGPSCSTWNACGYPSCTYPRAGWCPGYIACHHNKPCDNDIDLTAEIPPGGSYEFDYDVVPRNGSWPISVVLFWYE